MYLLSFQLYQICEQYETILNRARHFTNIFYIAKIESKKVPYYMKTKNLEDLRKEYDRLQLIHGDSTLDAIYNGGCADNPDIMFVFMNPTGRNIASSKSWHGLKAPWIGTKNIWDLFSALDLIDQHIYAEIKGKKGKDWTPEFAQTVYDDIAAHKIFINNLGKCTQIDARPLPNSVYLEYLDLLKKEIELVDPRVIVLFGNQVSTIVLGQNISVSQTRKKEFSLVINGKTYPCFPVFYPVGNGRFNIDKSIEDIEWIKENILKEGIHV